MINIGCKDRGIDKYEILADRYGLESSKQLSPAQVDDFIKHLEHLGWEKQPGKKSKFVPYQTGPQRKVAKMWSVLGKAGVLDKPGDESLQRYVRKMTKKSHLKFCDKDNCNIVIEGLKAWGKRENVDVY